MGKTQGARHVQAYPLVGVRIELEKPSPLDFKLHCRIAFLRKKALDTIRGRFYRQPSLDIKQGRLSFDFASGDKEVLWLDFDAVYLFRKRRKRPSPSD